MLTLFLWFVGPMVIYFLVLVLRPGSDPTDDIRMYFKDLDDLE